MNRKQKKEKRLKATYHTKVQSAKVATVHYPSRTLSDFKPALSGNAAVSSEVCAYSPEAKMFVLKAKFIIWILFFVILFFMLYYYW